MLFSSVTFLFFFLPFTLTVFLLLRNRVVARNVFLLIMSLIFYFLGEKIYLVLMLVMIVVNYLFGLWLERSEKKRKMIITMAVVFNLGTLGFYKYTNFLVNNINAFLGLFNIPGISISNIQSAFNGLFGITAVTTDKIHLPIGISFFTFQIMSYVIDLYRGKAEVQKNPVSLGLYISLFPQLVAGPIVRYVDIAKQLLERQVTLEGFAYGVRRFVVGMGKKVLIANVVAMTADSIFAIPTGDLTADIAWLGLVCYTLQLYFDFSGYSDMAIGLGRMFGFTFMENFNYPYMGRSLRQFWSRWHISLTTWFRDYLYFPLGGSMVSKGRSYFNTLLVFLLTGMWHGANWTFIVWGIWHGAFMVMERILPDNFFENLWRPVGNAYQLMVVMLSLVMFRSPSIVHTFYYTGALFGQGSGTGKQHAIALYLNSELAIAIIIGCIGSYPFIPWLKKKYDDFIADKTGAVLTAYQSAYSAFVLVSITGMLILSAMALASDTYNPFIYERF